MAVDAGCGPLHVPRIDGYVGDTVPMVLILRLLNQLARTNIIDIG